MYNKKISIIIYVIYSIVLLLGILYFIDNFRKYKNELLKFEKKEISGVITNLNNTQRGTYDISTSSGELIPNLRIGWELERYFIKVGDSLNKKENSKIITFYKVKNGIPEKCFDYEIGL